MSPNRYVLLQRLDMVRAALRRAYSPTATVAELARRYGFSGALPRKSIELFGEATFRRRCDVRITQL
jgi:hypothetical protein